jgi:Tol biopolymer transport system component
MVAAGFRVALGGLVMRALLWRVIVAVSVATVAAIVSVHASQAAYPGRNGKIVFWTFGYCCDLIWTMNADGSDLRAIYSNGSQYARYPEVSPDGTKIVVVAGFSINVINFDGVELFSLPQTESSGGGFGGSPPIWSPDSNRLAWIGANDLGGPGLWVGSATGQALIYPSQTIGLDSVRWSPDGSKLSFIDRGVIYVINRDGSGLHAVASPPFPPDPGRTPTSPDGTKRIYTAPVAATAPSTQVFISNLDGSDARQLTNLTADCDAATTEPHSCANNPLLQPPRAFNPGFLVWQTLPLSHRA